MKLEFPKPLQTRMRRELNRAGFREIGGILMAEQIETGHFRLADFSIDPRAGRETHFVRDPKHHDEALSGFFERTGENFGSFNYLGEWHSHPSFSAYPSAADIRSMHDIVETEPSIPFAVLLVVRSRWRIMLECSAMLFKRGGHRSEVEFVW